jgi:hypothetical protein
MSSVALHIHVENRNLQAGAVLQGVIYLHVTQPTPAQELVLYFKGIEKTEWSISEKERDMLTDTYEDVTHTYIGRRDIITQRFPMFLFADSTIQPGHFSFPFSICTPTGLPNSFRYKPEFLVGIDDGPLVAAISYKIVAKLEGKITQKSALRLNLTQPPANTPVPMSGHTQANISTWCCLGKGTVAVSADFDKNQYVPGETATITIDVNNEESQLIGTGLSATLTRVIRMRDNSGRQHIITSKVCHVALKEEIASGKSPAAATKRTLQLPIPRDETMEGAGTVASQLVDCEYFLAGEVVMDGNCMCCGDSPKVSKAMTVYPAGLERGLLPELPETWMPQAMQKQDFVVAYQGPTPSAPPLS